MRILPLAPSRFDDFLEIRVSDNGIGISEQDLPNLFQSFRQLGSSLKRQYEGTGLGLSLVSRLAELHGGTVGVASALQQGAIFTVWLPWRIADTEAEADAQLMLGAPVVVGNPVPAQGKPNRRALVIDDDQHAALLLRIHLESAGFQVQCAFDSATALELAGRKIPDLITLDLLMPGASGWETLDMIKAHPALDAVPVVIVSVLADEQQGFALGATKLLQKPVVRKTLLEAISAVGLDDQTFLTSTVLVVDEDPQACAMVAAHLDRPSCKVLHAYDGRSAIETARQFRPDLMILDLMLPDISGFEVVDTLKAALDVTDMPILVLTAETVSKQDRERLNGRVSHIMEKGSFSRQDFLAEVRRALGRKHLPSMT